MLCKLQVKQRSSKSGFRSPYTAGALQSAAWCTQTPGKAKTTRSTTLNTTRKEYIKDEVVRLAMEKQGKDGSRQNCPLNNLVCVSVFVVGGTIGTHSHHQIANVKSERQIQNFHYGVVKDQPAWELWRVHDDFVKIEVSRHKYNEIESLRFERYTYNSYQLCFFTIAGFCLSDL